MAKDNKSNKNLKSSKGAVLAEFVVTVPLVILFIAGITEMGRVLDQVGHISQMAYHGVMTGANSVSSLREAAAVNEVAEIHSIVSPKFGFDPTNPVTAVATNDPTSPYITVTVPGVLPTTVSDWDLSFSVNLTGPVLVKDFVEISNTFENPTVTYDCAGEPNGSQVTPCSCDELVGSCSSE